MGRPSRDKGKAGEREIAAILAEHLGLDVRRRVRQHEGDSDLEGLPDWSIEVKRYARVTRGDLRGWWDQTRAQAAGAKARPVLFWRGNHDEWRAVWPLPALMGVSEPDLWPGYAWTCEGSVMAWCAVARELLGART